MTIRQRIAISWISNCFSSKINRKILRFYGNAIITCNIYFYIFRMIRHLKCYWEFRCRSITNINIFNYRILYSHMLTPYILAEAGASLTTVAFNILAIVDAIFNFSSKDTAFFCSSNSKFIWSCMIASLSIISLLFYNWKYALVLQ